MKPLPMALLTVEDFGIWLSLAARFPELRYPDRRILLSDRRDAELMNWAQTIRRVREGGYRMLGPLDDQVYAWQENVHHCGGDITRFV